MKPAPKIPIYDLNTTKPKEGAFADQAYSWPEEEEDDWLPEVLETRPEEETDWEPEFIELDSREPEEFRSGMPGRRRYHARR